MAYEALEQAIQALNQTNTTLVQTVEDKWASANSAATRAETAASTAESSESNAAVSAAAAEASQVAAEASEASASASADSASASASGAAASESGASFSAAGAATSAASAAAAADVAQLSTSIYPNTASGIAATVSGEYFSVPSPESDEYLILYLNSSWSAVEQKRYPSSSRIASLEERTVSISDVIPASVPVAVTSFGQVALWLESGALNAAGVAASLVEKIRNGLALDAAFAQVLLEAQQYSDAELSDRIPALVNQQSIIPIVASALTGQIAVWLEDGLLDACGVTVGFKEKIVSDIVSNISADPNGIVPIVSAGNSVALWLDGGLLGAKGLSPSLLIDVASSLPVYSPLVAPASAKIPVSTDGRSLSKWRAKIGRWLSGDTSSHLKLGFTGDSWTELNDIPVAFRAMLEKTFPRAGGGWDSAPSGNKPGGANITYSGWAWFDGSNVHASGIPTGIDGHNISTSSATATLTLTTAAATDVSIFYENSTGTFRYSVDGAAYVSVVGSDDGTIGNVSLTGLSDTTHTIQIDTIGNTGVVYLLGFYETRSTAGGIEILRMGNGGLSGAYLSEFVDNVQPIAEHLDIDVLIVILGTNDYRYASSTPANYIEALTQLASAYRAATPDIGLIFIAPADTNGTAFIPLVDYRDAMYEFCILNGYEFYNLHDCMGTWFQEDALGQFADSLHMNGSGAANLANEVNRKFLNV